MATRNHRKKTPVPVDTSAGNDPITDQTPQPLPETRTPHTPADNCPPPPEGDNGNTAIILPGDCPAEETDHHTLPQPGSEPSRDMPRHVRETGTELETETEPQSETENEIEPESESETENETEPESESETENETESENETGNDTSTPPDGNPLLQHRELLDRQPDAPFYTTLQEALRPGSDPRSRNQALERLDTLVRIARLIARITPRKPQYTENLENPEENTPDDQPRPDAGPAAPPPYLSREYRRMQQHPNHYRPGLLDEQARPHVSPKNH